MSATRYITLNGITSTLLINESEGQINWTLNLADAKDNHASTNGTYTIKNATKTDIVYNNAQHVSRIMEMIEDVNYAVGKYNKIPYACILFNYILKDALEFSKKHDKFRKVIIDKCYEMKEVCSESLPLVSLSNRILTALSAPLEKQSSPTAGLVQSSPTASLTASGLVPEVKSEVKSEEKPAQNIIDDFILESAIKDYEYTFGEHAWNTADSRTKEVYIRYAKGYEEDRVRTMKPILAKKGLTFDESIMARYHTWEKTFKPAKPVNRFQKMSEFVKTLSAK